VRLVLKKVPQLCCAEVNHVIRAGRYEAESPCKFPIYSSLCESDRIDFDKCIGHYLLHAVFCGLQESFSIVNTNERHFFQFTIFI